MPRRSTSDYGSDYDDATSSAGYTPASAAMGGSASTGDYLDPDDPRSRRRQQRSNTQMWMILGGVAVVGLWLAGLFATFTLSSQVSQVPPVAPGKPSPSPAVAPGSPGTSPRPGSEGPPGVTGGTLSGVPVPVVLAGPSSLPPERRAQLLQGVVGIVASGAKPPQKPGASSTGTGFVVDARGYVVTSAQVVQGKQQVEVSASDGSSHKAQVVAREEKLNVALLKVSTLSTSRPLALGDTSLAQSGNAIYVLGYSQDAVASGTPNLLEGTVRTLRPLVQTDVSADKGSAGGPLVLASSGEVIGVVTFKAGSTETKVTAQPINAVRGWLVKNIR